ncbi:uncharacterized protein F5147DRAFT_764635 [Suillus discolor]|uniref:Uncharacterized protein n=1 Tax=Suillus discolor TaxID=1912936 RepID=A0A9P7ETU1_9AGAM|nr:uncharacterized protein F5147DRAFT_764635 [Suillus discolor]KAG2088913.1 hypothetical protein F5147DRAFT_764635 [Suillus discolor]
MITKYYVSSYSVMKQVLPLVCAHYTPHGTDEKSVVNNTAKKDHFREQLEDGPADCYLAALCLDPPVPDILTSPTYVRVLKYLKIVIEAEFKSQHNPALKGKTAADVREAFVHQFERYALFNERMDSLINGFGSAQDNSAEDDADLEGMDTEWSEIW